MTRISLLLLSTVLSLFPVSLATSVSTEVQKHIESIKKQYQEYIYYAGPSENITETASTRRIVEAASGTAASASCFYWLDSIPRQGVAAFNTNSTYSVYRNVMDWGAKGECGSKVVPSKYMKPLIPMKNA